MLWHNESNESTATAAAPRQPTIQPKVVTTGSAGGHVARVVGMTPKSAELGPSAKVGAVNFYGITSERTCQRS